MGMAGRRENKSAKPKNRIVYQISDYENQGFDFLQLKEIQSGIEAYVDVSLYADLDFLFLQMREIRLGLEKGLDVGIYADAAYNWFQMCEIRKGLEAGVDVKVYADSALDFMVMKELRKGLQAGIDLMPYYKKKMSTEVLRAIRKSKEHGCNIEKYALQGYDSGQLEQIEAGLRHGMDISLFLNQNLTGSQMCEIRLGAESGVDVSIYAKPEYNWMQMREIRMGLEHGVSVYWYQDVNFSARQMREIRLGLEDGQEVFSYATFIWSATDMREMRLGRKPGLTGGIFKTDALKGTRHNSGKEHEQLVASDENADIRSGIRITLSEDEMQAEMMLLPPVNGRKYTGEMIMEALSRFNVKQGILGDVISEMVDGEQYNESRTIAQGRKVINGDDGAYQFFFKTELPTIPKILDDDSVDYQNVDFFEMVSKGQKLAAYTPPTNGVYGYTVTAKLIQPKKGRELPALHGRGFEIRDEYTYYARIDGRIEQHGNTLQVLPVYLHDGDLTLSVGNIRFNGDVHITGYVGSGVIIEASGDVIVDGQVEGASIRAGGSVLIRSGVSGGQKAKIEAGRKIYGKFFEEACLTAEDNIETNYMMNCTSVSMAKIIVSGQHGSIVGGSTYAVKGIEAHNIGNQAEVKSYFEIGKNTYYLKRKAELAEKKTQLEKEAVILRQQVMKYQQTYGFEQLESLSIYQNVKMAMFECIKKSENAAAELKKFTEDRYITAGMVNLRVDGTAYRGCTVSIDGYKMPLANSVSHVMFRQQDGRVAMFRNYPKR